MHTPKKSLATFAICIFALFAVLALNSYDLAQISLHRGAAQPARLFFIVAATLGDGRAQNNLASMYAEGRGGAQNDEKAVYWYQRAVDSGIAQAMFNLANFYEEGRGVARNTPRAAALYQQAADKGDILASFNLGVLYATQRPDFSPDYTAAANWYLKAANAGYASAQYNLGNLYVNGLKGTKDIESARKWYEKAAAQGHAKAVLDLGAIHVFGLSRTSDPELGIKLLQKAAQNQETAGAARKHLREMCTLFRQDGIEHRACSNPQAARTAY